MHDGVWDMGDYIPILFFKFILIFYVKIGPRGKWIFQKYFKIIILIFGWPCIFYKIYYHFRYTTLYNYIPNYFINYFLKNLSQFFMKNRPTWWDECPWKLIKIIYNYEIYKLEYEHLMNIFENILDYMSLLNLFLNY